MSNKLFAQTHWAWKSFAVVVIGAMLARWYWVLAGSGTTVAPVLPERTPAMTGQVFGVAVSGAAPVQGATLSGARLVGVFTGARGFAVFTKDSGKTQNGVALGEEVVPGVKLVEIDKDSVVLESAGARQKIELEGYKKSVASANAAFVSGVGMHHSKI
jgi:general secretion pathway protein C